MENSIMITVSILYSKYTIWQLNFHLGHNLIHIIIKIIHVIRLVTLRSQKFFLQIKIPKCQIYYYRECNGHNLNHLVNIALALFTSRVSEIR